MVLPVNIMSDNQIILYIHLIHLCHAIEFVIISIAEFRVFFPRISFWNEQCFRIYSFFAQLMRLKLLLQFINALDSEEFFLEHQILADIWE